MNKWIKIVLVLASFAVLSLGLMAFRPWGGESAQDSSSEITETLAEVLGISVEDLQAAQQAAKEAALAQAVADGTLTQEEADAILNRDNNEFGGRSDGRFRFAGVEFDTFLADELAITVDELNAARQEAKSRLMAQAVEAGTLSQEDFDLMQAHDGVQPYLQDALQQAFQDAVDAALEDGAITETQAQLLLDNLSSGEFGMGSFRAPGSHGGKGVQRFPGDAADQDNPKP